ncbi:MAG: YdcF family protein [Vulcanimicrobiota bacterium]
MLFVLRQFVKALLVPPGTFFVLAGLGVLLLKKRPVWGKAFLAGLALLIYFCSTFSGSVLLTRLAASEPYLVPAQAASVPAQAIVVLGGGRSHFHGEFPDSVQPAAASMARVSYAAYLRELTGLPVLVSGGGDPALEYTEAYGMARLLHRLGVDEVWLETASTNTWDNAEQTARILLPRGIRRLLVVTDPVHAGRARRCFESHGFEVTMAPTGETEAPVFGLGLVSLKPDSGCLLESTRAWTAIQANLVYGLLYY